MHGVRAPDFRYHAGRKPVERGIEAEHVGVHRALRPAGRLVQELRRSLKRQAAEVERESNPRVCGEMAHEREIGLCFAAEDQMTQSRIEQVLGAMTIRDAVVDPGHDVVARDLALRHC